MQTFDPDAACPKCGHRRASTRWCSQAKDKVAGCQHGGEHMHRTCSRCRYVWFEAPLAGS